jgi:hypothetical protein
VRSGEVPLRRRGARAVHRLDRLRRRALRLRRGVRVTVTCNGVSKGRGSLLLLDIDRIDEPDLVIRNVTGEARDL